MSQVIESAVVVDPAIAANLNDNASVGHDDADNATAVALSREQEAHAAAEAKAMAEATATLNKMSAAAKRSRESFVKGMFDTGRLAGQFVNQLLAPPLSKKRAAAIDTIEAQLTRVLFESVDANKLIAANAARELFGVAPTAVRRFIDWKDHFSKLVVRYSEANGTEGYHILPGMVEECKACVEKVTREEYATKEIASAVAEIVAEHASRERAAREESAKIAREQAEASEREKRQAQETVRAAEAAVVETKQAAAVAVDGPEKIAAQKAAEAAEIAKRDAEEKARLAEKESREAQRKADKEEREKRLAQEREKKMQERAQRRAEAEAGEGPSNLVKGLASGTAKDTAGTIADAIGKHETPDDVFYALLRALDNHPSLSKGAHRVVRAALVQVTAELKKSEAA